MKSSFNFSRHPYRHPYLLMKPLSTTGWILPSILCRCVRFPCPCRVDGREHMHACACPVSHVFVFSCTRLQLQGKNADAPRSWERGWDDINRLSSRQDPITKAPSAKGANGHGTAVIVFLVSSLVASQSRPKYRYCKRGLDA